jgi:predicted O-methyltransferase YrrM
MRSIKHWTPRYIAARLREMIYQRRNRDLPWLTQDANRFLQTYLLRSDSGVEFGSGRSTLWLASRVGRLVSLEHNRDWYKRVSEALAQEQVLNVDYRYLAGDMNDMNAMEEAICRITDGLPSAQFDFVLVDGVCRDICTREALRLLRPGGMLVIDNVNRHLPSISMSPESRSLELGPDGLLWDEIARTIKPWRHYWTSSGVTDTAFYFKPVDT